MTAELSETSQSPAGDNRLGGGRLTSLPTGSRLTSEEAAAHSVLIRRLRVILPALALILVVVFVANTGGNAGEDVFLDEFADVNTATEELRMTQPKFSDIDDDGTPFDITADAAIQAPGDTKHISLERPRAISGSDDKQSVISAENGDYDSEEKILNLEKDVVFEHSIGSDRYVLNAPDATFSIDDETIISESGVIGEGPRGARLAADKMYADNKTRRVIFEGNVRTRIYPDRENNKKCAESGANGETPPKNALLGSCTGEKKLEERLR